MTSLQNQLESYYQDPVAQPYYAPLHGSSTVGHMEARSPYYHENVPSLGYDGQHVQIQNGYYSQEPLGPVSTVSTAGNPSNVIGPSPASNPASIAQVHMPQPSMDTSAEQPFYVNAKQYHRILKRRIARARLEETLKIARTRRPYLHESRHKHAMRRPRGQGGRFLTAAELAKKERLEKLKESEISQEDATTSTPENCTDMLLAVKDSDPKSEPSLGLTDEVSS